MISRLTACAATFACIATTTIAWAANTQQTDTRTAARAIHAEVSAPAATPIVRFETVVITGRRSAIVR